MRRRIFQIIETAEKDDKASHIYDIFMIGVIVISLIPLTMKEPGHIWYIIDNFCVAVFIVDYILRLSTADYKYQDSSILSFVRYPFSPMAIIDLLSILPSFLVVNKGLRLLRLLRLLRSLRVFRAFRALRYSKNFEIIASVIKRSKDSLIAVCVVTIFYIVISAMVVFNVEPDSFDNFFEAIYWATVSLTTVGYGDIYPVTTVGRIITMVSSVFGIAVVALPAGIITAGYIKELEERQRNDIDGEQK